jgi:hypothetical protein
MNRCYLKTVCGIPRQDLRPSDVYYNWRVEVNCENCLKLRPQKVVEKMEVQTIRKVMSIMGKRGGIKGGLARAKSLSPERRKEIASLAAKKRWANAT